MFQLDFADFHLEESDRCLYDSLTVLGDVEGTEEIGRMDGSLGGTINNTLSQTQLNKLRPIFFSLALFVLLCLCLPVYLLPAVRGLFCHVLCSGAVRGQRSPSCPVLPQRHGASVYVRQQHHTQRLQGYTNVHQPYRYVRVSVCELCSESVLSAY